MRVLALCLLALVISTHAEPIPSQCEEIGRRAAASVARLDTAFRLQGSRLKGEIEMSKTALLGCVAQNKQVETRASLLWFLTDIGFVVGGFLLLFHQRRMKKAILALNKMVTHEKPDHSKAYMPGQGYFRAVLCILCLGILGINFVALVL
jgi:hypothetical protein